MTGKQHDPMLEVLERLRHVEGARARELLERAAEAHPADPRPLLLLAAEHMHEGRVDAAEALYIAALQRAPDFAIARFQLGLLQFTSGRPAAAQATWSLLERLDEKDPLRLFKTGLELLGQDRFDEARRWLREGIAHNASNPPLNRDMQMVLDRMDQVGLGTPDAAHPGPANGEAAEPESHVLVSAYRNAR